MIQSLFDFLKKKWVRLIGDSSRYSLEQRVFHSFCVIALIAALYSVVFNCWVGLQVSAYIFAGMTVMLAYAFYLSRLKQKINTGLILGGVTANLSLALNYVYNSGIKGPSLLLLVLAFFLLISVSPRRYYVLWFSLSLGCALTLLGLEYAYPSLIIDTYPSPISRYLDTASVYLSAIILIYAGVTFTRRNYYKERNMVLEKTRQLEKLNSEKDKLFSIISHDLRTPLAMVQQYLELLKAFDLEPEERESIKAGLLQATRNTQDLLSNLLAWSNNQMGGMRVDLKGLNLQDTLTKTLSALQMIAAQKQQTLQVDIAPEIDVWADKDMLQLVIRNLVSNAIKFTPNGGAIRVFTQMDGYHCVLVVQDEGVGIDRDRQQDLFSLKTTSTFGTQNEKGVGLGLLLCKEYTGRQNGKIWFKSQLGQGTSFYVSLPVFVNDGVNASENEPLVKMLS